MRQEEAVEQTSVWEYSPLSEYDVPSGLTADALRGFRRVSQAVWTAVRETRSEKGDPVERRRPSPEMLADLLPRFDVESAAGALEAALESWPDGEPCEIRIRTVVGPPGSDTQGVVEALARRRQWAEIAPPPRADLLGAAGVIPEQLTGLEPGSARPTVIAGLHRWLLRSELGLTVIRTLLGKLRDQSRPLLIGCDSWAWSFLDRTLGIRDLFGEPLALVALDAPRLESWLGAPLRSRGRVCHAAEKEDESVFALSSGAHSEQGSDGNSASPVLVKLASAARGNPGVALELWKRCLCLTDKEPGRGDGDQSDRAATIWAAPLGESEVVVPSKLESAHKFVLHAALVHGGLERDLLHAVLPFSRHDLLRRVRDLSEEDLLIETEGEVSVPLAAYAAVRRYVESEGFLVDDF